MHRAKGVTSHGEKGEGKMDWVPTAILMTTFVATAVAVTGLGWRVAERIRRESREAHDRIGARIDGVKDELGARIDGVKDELGARIDGVEARLGGRIDGVEAGLGTVREGLAEIRGEFRGVTQSLDALREDFRAHVFRQAGDGH